MEMQSTVVPVRSAAQRLDTLALAVAFGVAGIALVVLSGAVMGATWGMMGTGAFANGSMMGSGGTMMGGGLGMMIYALVVAFLGGALVGGVTAAIYNNIVARRA